MKMKAMIDIKEEDLNQMAHALGLNGYEPSNILAGEFRFSRNHYCGAVPESLLERKMIETINTSIPTVDTMWRVTELGQTIVTEWLGLSPNDRREFIQRINTSEDTYAL